MLLISRIQKALEEKRFAEMPPERSRVVKTTADLLVPYEEFYHEAVEAGKKARVHA